MARPLLPSEKREGPSSSWLVAIANLLDFFTVFVPCGFAIAYIAGTATPNKISLSGIPMLITLAIVAAYFLVFSRYLGGPIWARILRVRRRQTTIQTTKKPLFPAASSISKLR